MIPVSECNRRSRKDVPCPARSGATPCLTLAGAAGLAVVATMTAPYEFGWEDRTFYYPGRMEGKSRERDRFVTRIVVSRVQVGKPRRTSLRSPSTSALSIAPFQKFAKCGSAMAVLRFLF